MPRVLSVHKILEKERQTHLHSNLSSDLVHKVIEKSTLQPGYRVFVNDMQRDAEVVAWVSTPRSYVIQETNRRHNAQMQASLPSLGFSGRCSSDGSPVVEESKVSKFWRVIKPGPVAV